MPRTATHAEKVAREENLARFNASFAGQLRILKACQAGNDHKFVADPQYGNKEFCTVCETEKV